MKILVIGSGGREHALVWRLAQSAGRPKIYATPGNPGIAKLATLLPAGDSSPNSLLATARSVEADLTVVGPEAPLVAGVVDEFRAAGLKSTLPRVRVPVSPFPDRPPRYLRARYYRYWFTTADERRKTGNWWNRQLVSEYVPPITLASFSR